jgi:hypothetical protein
MRASSPAFLDQMINTVRGRLFTWCSILLLMVALIDGSRRLVLMTDNGLIASRRLGYIYDSANRYHDTKGEWPTHLAELDLTEGDKLDPATGIYFSNNLSRMVATNCPYAIAWQGTGVPVGVWPLYKRVRCGIFRDGQVRHVIEDGSAKK